MRATLPLHSTALEQATRSWRSRQVPIMYSVLKEPPIAKKGIITRCSTSQTPEQNSAAVIINRVLLNKVKALLLESNLPTSIQGKALLLSGALCLIRPKVPLGALARILQYKRRENRSNTRKRFVYPIPAIHPSILAISSRASTILQCLTLLKKKRMQCQRYLACPYCL